MDILPPELINIINSYLNIPRFIQDIDRGEDYITVQVFREFHYLTKKENVIYWLDKCYEDCQPPEIFSLQRAKKKILEPGTKKMWCHDFSMCIDDYWIIIPCFHWLTVYGLERTSEVYMYLFPVRNTDLD